MSTKVKVRQKVKVDDNIYDPEIDKAQEYTFENVFKLKENEWTTVMSGQQLGEMWRERKILFHKDCQRGIKLERSKDGKLIERAVFSKKNINEIKNAIVRNDYSPDEITLNILNDDSEISIEGNTMHCKGKILIVDGQHRLRGLAELVNSNEIIGYDSAGISDKYFNVKITNYDLEKSAEIFSQFTKGLKISKSLSESYNKKNAVNRIVNELNRVSVLKGKIDKVKTSIIKSDTTHVTTFATLVNAIKDSYGDILDEKMERDVLDFLKIFFSELTKMFPELIDDEERQLSKEYTLVAENFMMYCWVELSQLLYCKRFSPTWKEELAKVENINFYKLIEDEELNPIWSSILRMTTNGTVSIVNNSSTRQTARRIIKEQFYLAQN